MSLPKISQFGSSSVLSYLCNVVITATFLDAGDIEIARIGLLVYWLFFNLFGVVMHTYIYIT